MADPAQLANSLDRLAASRQSCSQPTTVLQSGADDQGRPQYTLQCSTAADSPVSSLLLSAFQEATNPASRAHAGQGLLPRGLEIAVARAPAAEQHSSVDQPNGGAHQGQQEQGLTIQFTTTEPAAEAQVEEASRLFEASAECRGCRAENTQDRTCAVLCWAVLLASALVAAWLFRCPPYCFLCK